ncbi:Lipoprotein-anchoring transpeptidase ErfK/SrfK [Aliiroseovarius sediminilitoris]|uniref:Lipoprotein-anchoring transpeptidase ErfK/SrfK n=1 Tax=Aliiroseovarius sediminilitoris TaxID=1173584 RepID=A0A1I0N6F3_9RHOB|nr:L,D-transpeptidase [Aliiroseovarius sediminilitoris]SEV96483.1 Lipoprotein-anchoring transpeptidase ErfK/SrfK [Aliiroseovarius sediminilitoris]
MLTRRHFVITSAALFSAPIASPLWAQDATTTQASATSPVIINRRPVSDRSKWAAYDAQVTPANYDPATSNPWGLHPRFLPKLVQAKPGLRPGDIHVDAVARYLYHIRDNGTAMRFGVAIGRGNLYEPGTYTIRRKAKWPTWVPTPAMVKRDPDVYGPLVNGMDGGPNNPLGSRAFYLYVGNRDTYLRIHGSPEPRSIGGRASSGCVRMVMPHIIGLYEQVDIGVTAYLYPAETVTARS